MALIPALGTAVSGLDANNSWMTVIGNNISNVNTVGYKNSQVEFADLFSQTSQSASAPSSGSNIGGINAIQSGLGTEVQAINTDMSQGAIQNTTTPTNMAINGNGFFILKSGANTSYSRAGDFSFDSAGDLVNPNGQIVQGWVANEITNAQTINAGANTVIQGDSIQLNTTNASAITNINIPAQDLTIAQQTTQVNLGGNLDNNTPVNNFSGLATFGVGGTALNVVQAGANVFNGTVPNSQTTTTVYDSLGNPQQLTIYYYRDANNANGSPTWDWYAFNTTGNVTPSNTNCVGGSYITAVVPVPQGLPAVPAAAPNTYQTLQFNSDGSLATNGGFGTNLPNEVMPNAVIVFQPTPVGAAGITLGTGATKSLDITLNFGTSNTWAGVGAANNQAGDAVTQVNGQFEFGARNGVTGDVTGSFQTVNGVSTYVPNSTPDVLSQNGYTDGTLESVSVDNQGDIVGSFTNNQHINLAKVALATFSNPEGLSNIGGSEFATTANSGNAVVGNSGQYGLGSITGSALESSNVNLSTELTNMIIAERGYEANARTISTSDEMINTVITMGQNIP